MNRWLWMLATFGAWSTGFGQEQKRQPPPDFMSGYQLPYPTTPPARADLFGWIDVAVLFLILSITAWAVIVRRSRTHVLVIVAFSIAYFGFYRLGCVCSVGSIQNVALAIGDPGYRLPFAVGAFFLLPIVFALFFGRVFCAGACPLGAIQEAVLLKPIRVPVWLENSLSVVPFLYLGFGVLLSAVGAGFVFCRYDPFIGFYRLNGGTLMMSIGIASLLLSVFVGRPFCRFLCPYGAILRVFSWFAKWPAKVTPAECIQCHLCATECPYGAIQPPTPEKSPDARSPARRALGWRVALAPVLVAVFVVLGVASAPTFATIHPTVALAERLYDESRGAVKGTTLQTDAHRLQAHKDQDVYAKAAEIERKFAVGTPIFTGYAGFVIALQWISLALVRKRRDYIANPGSCVSCARCFASCPVLPLSQR